MNWGSTWDAQLIVRVTRGVVRALSDRYISPRISHTFNLNLYKAHFEKTSKIYESLQHMPGKPSNATQFIRIAQAEITPALHIPNIKLNFILHSIASLRAMNYLLSARSQFSKHVVLITKKTL